MRYQSKRRFRVLPAILIVLAIAIGSGGGAFAALWLTDDGIPAAGAAPNGTPAQPPPDADEANGQAQPAATPNSYGAIPLPGEYRGMWFAFLEWEQVDLSTEQSARGVLGEMFDNCKTLGLNTVIVHVRPFGDALYRSALFPWSHLLTGTQGQDPGYDPLALMVELAHQRNLRIEALVNPFRVKHSIHGPEQQSNDNPAIQNPGWVREYNGNLMYDPALPEVRQMVADGILEIVENYDVDGIQFDDYFYPEGIDESFDAETFAAREDSSLALAAWRRENINQTVRGAYAAVKSGNPTASFGISPAGNNDNNLNRYHADVKHWMANAGYVDYVMPQLYWGFTRVEQSGRDDFAFDNIADAWAFYPRDAGVRLYAGLGAYRVGKPGDGGERSEFGHGGAGDQSEWESGEVLASMVRHLRGSNAFSGFALFRYEFLYQNGDALSAAEREALAAALAES